MAQWGKLNFAQKTCLGLCGKLMQRSAMVGPGSRVGVAISGGVDSFVMLQILMLRQRIVPYKFEIMPIHLNPGFDPASHAPLVDWLRKNGLPAHIELTDFGPRAHSEENRKKSACFYCAMLRRKRLFDLCGQYGLTHLAFGHNLDDLVENFFMNMFLNGRVDGMNHAEDFFGGRLKVIRPMLLVEKKDIRRACSAWELPLWTNPCPSAVTGKRAETREWLRELCAKDRRIRKNLLAGMVRRQLDLIGSQT